MDRIGIIMHGVAEVLDTETTDNGFKAQWEMFLRHVPALEY